MFGEYTPLITPELFQRRLASGKARLDPILGLEKRCPRCCEYWPQDTLFWRLSNQSIDGLQSWCKGCQLEDKNRRNQKKRG